MIIKPKVRGFICTNAHPQGCAANVQEQIAFTKAKGPVAGAPKKVLVLGCSTGFGLASRITAAFGGGAGRGGGGAGSKAGAWDCAGGLGADQARDGQDALARPPLAVFHPPPHGHRAVADRCCVFLRRDDQVLPAGTMK